MKREAIRKDLTISDKANLFLTIGNIYDQNEQYDSSVHYLKIALEQFRILSDYGQIAYTLNKPGENHSFSGDDIKTLACFREVLDISDELSERSAIGDAMHNIGIVYAYDGKPDSSIYYYKKALELREILGDTSKTASSLRAMGEILRSMDRKDEALKIIPAGYVVAYEFDQNEIIKSCIWSKDGGSNNSTNDTKTRRATFAFGPVEDPIPDPSAKSSSTWLQDYIVKEMGEDMPINIASMIPEMDPKEVQNDINPDVIIQFGDG